MKDEIAKKLHSLIGDHDCLLNSPETCKACQIFNVFNKSLNETISKVREEESKKREKLREVLKEISEWGCGLDHDEIAKKALEENK